VTVIENGGDDSSVTAYVGNALDVLNNTTGAGVHNTGKHLCLTLALISGNADGTVTLLLGQRHGFAHSASRENALYTENTKVGDGSTEFTFEVTAGEKSVVFTVATDEKVLGDALQEYGLIAGEEQAFGLYVKEVNGIRADYDLDKAYWSLQKNGELLPEQMKEFYALWEDYTAQLEIALKTELTNLYSNIDGIISKQFTSSQKKFKNGIIELVFNVVKSVTSAFVPGAGLLLDLAEYGKLGVEGINNYIMLNNKREMDYLIQQKKDVYAYIEKCMLGATVITKYRK
jgi:hypothetical protein